MLWQAHLHALVAGWLLGFLPGSYHLLLWTNQLTFWPSVKGEYSLLNVLCYAKYTSLSVTVPIQWKHGNLVWGFQEWWPYTPVFISNTMANSHFLILAYLAKMVYFNWHGCLRFLHNVLDLQQVQIFCNSCYTEIDFRSLESANNQMYSN